MKQARIGQSINLNVVPQEGVLNSRPLTFVSKRRPQEWNPVLFSSVVLKTLLEPQGGITDVKINVAAQQIVVDYDHSILSGDENQ
jgi:hypothetical protein